MKVKIKFALISLFFSVPAMRPRVRKKLSVVQNAKKAARERERRSLIKKDPVLYADHLRKDRERKNSKAKKRSELSPHSLLAARNKTRLKVKVWRARKAQAKQERFHTR